MTPDRFIAKWRASELKERSAAQEHFVDLCRLLDVATPAEADPTGESYCFEKGALKSTGGKGWADVWKRHHFGWEYKGRRADLTAAYAQLQRYAVALENPPLLVVCDTDRIVIHTNWTNTVSRVHTIALEDLRDAAARDTLRRVFTEPERLKPAETRQGLTEQAAGEFAELAKRLRGRRHDPQAVAHFVNRLAFCMFAEDVDLLPARMFTRMLEAAAKAPEQFEALAAQLFGTMRAGGMVGFEKVAWFNGGLFDDASALPLEKDDIALVLRAARLEWQDIDPSIIGTLFERGLDPDKRSQLGAHYTDPATIMKIVDPVIVRPLALEWRLARQRIEAALHRADGAKGAQAQAARTRARNEAQAIYRAFLDRLWAYRVLDPACGSGNFLYLALLALKDLEHKAGLEVEALGLAREFPRVGPEALKGIEINPYAAELARVTVWIGEIQWMRRNGFAAGTNPILKPLETIECRDALLNPDGTEAAWPQADAIVGNPPFLGGKLLRRGLGDAAVDRLFAAYDERVPPEADLVCYWFEKARVALQNQPSLRVGLVATNSIRGGANRKVLAAIAAQHRIIDAWDDEPWILDGAAVRVSLVCFASKASPDATHLDGHAVPQIHPDLTAQTVDLTSAARLAENQGVSFMGDTKGGAFDVQSDVARAWLVLPTNPNGQTNANVLRPWRNGMDVTRRASDRWIIDFGTKMTEHEASMYEAPFRHALQNVRPQRMAGRRETYRRFWWRHAEARQGMWSALRGLRRYIATPTVSKHRLFIWLESSICPDHQLIVVARDDDTTFGILHARFHEVWSLRKGTWLGVGNDPRYTPSTTFETYPFPEGMTPNLPAAAYAGDPRAQAIAAAAARLDELREAWLNPPDLVRREPEVVPGFPDRVLPVDAKAAAILKKRTLTNLYNERPAWLDHAHRDLDAAVAAAYGWPPDLDEDGVLARLFALNQERAAAGR